MRGTLFFCAVCAVVATAIAVRADSNYPNSVQGTLASGIGGVTALTLGTTPTTNAIPARSRRSLLIYNQSASATITVCTATGGVTPAAGAAGCYTLQPNGGSLAYPANSYIPQDGFNAVASAANTPVTVEQH